MKKKIFSFLLAICLIIPAIFVLTACDDTENPPEDTNIYVSTQEQLFNAVENTNDNKIVLTQDIEIDRQLTVTKKVTLDLNGKEIFNTTDIWNIAEGVKEWSLISVQGDGELTITGNGVLNAKENDCYAIDVRDSAKVIIKNGTITGNVSAVYVKNNATAVIEDGTYNIKQLSNSYNDYRYLLNALDEDNQDAKIVVKGGTFTQYDPSHSNSENPQMNFVAEGYESIENEGNYIVSKIAD